MPIPDFEAVYDEHVARIFGFFAYRLGSRTQAEDLTQTTFERALGSWERFDPARATRGTWLLAIARNLLIDHHRARGSRPHESGSLDTIPTQAVPRTEGPEASLGLSAELERALSALGDRERELVALRFGGDLSGPEIARMTGLSLANVQQIMSRSLRRMRGLLDGGSESERTHPGQTKPGGEEQHTSRGRGDENPP